MNRVKLTEIEKPGVCNGWQACYNTDPPMKEEGDETVQVFLCPAGAISKVGEEGIAIDTKRCFGCLPYVRNCFRVQKSNNIALTVEAMPVRDPSNLHDSIPDTHDDMAVVRQKTALDYEWRNSSMMSVDWQHMKPLQADHE